MSDRNKNIPFPAPMTPLERANIKIRDLKWDIEYYKIDLKNADNATIRAENDAMEAQEKQWDAEKELAQLKSGIANRNLEEGLYAKMEAQLRGTIAELQEDKRRTAEKLGAKMQVLYEANLKLQEDLNKCQEQLKQHYQLLTPIAKLVEMTETCKAKAETISIISETDEDETIAEDDMISFIAPSDPASGSERDGGSVLNEDLNLGAASTTGEAITMSVGTTAAEEKPKSDDTANVITEEEIKELELLLAED